MQVFKKYSSAVRDSVRPWVKEIGDVDILIGIPSFNNEDTIGGVITAVAQGLEEYFPQTKAAIFVSDGGSLDDTREKAQEASVPLNHIKRRVAIYRGMPGKGTSFRAVFEIAKLLKASACIVVDADLKSITPEWSKLLINPILEKKAEFVAPYYLRHKYDASITNHIVYPLTRVLYGKRIRQPIGGDFGFSGELAAFFAEQDVWLTDVARFGIDIWMTTSAINEGYPIAQANLGIKVHDSKDPAIDLGPMFRQVISTLLFLMGKYEDKWMKVRGSIPVETIGEISDPGKIESVAITPSKLEAEFVEGFSHFEPLYKQVIIPENFTALKDKVNKTRGNGEIDFPSDLWAKILYDFAFIYQTWNRNRRRLVDIITPLYFGRLGAYYHEVTSLDSEEAEKVIEAQAQTFEELKPYLREKFKSWE